MKIINRFWSIYSQSWWIPSVITLVLLSLPAIILLVVFDSYSLGGFEELLSKPQFIYATFGLYWLLVVTSLSLMAITGFYQIRGSMKGKGAVNIAVALFIASRIWLPIFLYITGLLRIGSL